ncbi:MAG TPA: FecR domain-containing protein [Woeseiaceae bacterium]|jgi:transmembrane sensor|nr:FecR domain-containing protein [Woeseiaceae bacterium]
MNRPADTAARTAEDEALRWVVDFDDLSEVEQARFHAWLDRNPEHWSAFERIERDWRRLDAIRRLATASPEPDVVERWLRRRRRWRRYVPLAAAATVAALGIFLSLLPGREYRAHYRTEVGQHETFELPDGSSIALNTDSEATVSYDASERRVQLLSGEAHFVVARAPERPFTVAAGTGLVRAVGTAFNIHMKGAAVEVTVAEGVVEVLPKAALVAAGDPGFRYLPAASAHPDVAPERLGKGQKIRYGEAMEVVSTVDPEEIARQLAWQSGMLDFRGDTLAEVVEEASRYTETRITIEDPEIRNLHVTGYLKAGDIDTLLELIESNEQIAVHRITPTLVHITANRD